MGKVAINKAKWDIGSVGDVEDVGELLGVRINGMSGMSVNGINVNKIGRISG